MEVVIVMFVKQSKWHMVSRELFNELEVVGSERDCSTNPAGKLHPNVIHCENLYSAKLWF